MDAKCLNELLSDPFSSYKSMTSVRSMCLPPRYIGNVSEGIRNQLDSEINLFSRELESVIVSYENIKLLQSVANIVDDLPFLQFRIQADYIVFKPTIGCLLKGVVNKVSKDHVGCLVHNRFNASIHRPQQNLNGWRGSKLQQGEEFPFQVVDIFSNNAVVSLKGKLVDQKIIETYIKSLEKVKSAVSSTSQEGVLIDSEGDITLGNEPELGTQKRKASEGDDDADQITEPPHKKKKTKRKSKSFEGHILRGMDGGSDLDKSNLSIPEDFDKKTSKKKKNRKRSDGKLSQDDSFAEDNKGEDDGRRRCEEVTEKRKERVKRKHEDRKTVVNLQEINNSDSDPSVEKRRKVCKDRSDGDVVESVENAGVVREKKKKKKKKDRKKELENEGHAESGDVNSEYVSGHLETEVENMEIDSRKSKKKMKHKHIEREIPVSPVHGDYITAPSSKKKKKKRKREETNISC